MYSLFPDDVCNILLLVSEKWYGCASCYIPTFSTASTPTWLVRRSAWWCPSWAWALSGQPWKPCQAGSRAFRRWPVPKSSATWPKLWPTCTPSPSSTGPSGAHTSYSRRQPHNRSLQKKSCRSADLSVSWPSWVDYDTHAAFTTLQVLDAAQPIFVSCYSSSFSEYE